jgi:hypothetical protein
VKLGLLHLRVDLRMGMLLRRIFEPKISESDRMLEEGA